MPRIAVIMPVFNRAKRLSQTLASLTMQTERTFVAVCVDDGSTDGSAEILERFRTSSGLDMEVIRQINAGVSAARNTGLVQALTHSDVTTVMFLDADDSYAPDCIAEMNRMIDAHPGAVCSFDFTMDGGAVRDGTESPCVWNKAYPRSLVSDVRFCEASNVAEDLAFNLEIRHRHHPESAHLHKTLYCYSQVADSTMHRALGEQDFKRRVNILEYLISVFADDPEEIDALCRDEIPELLKQFWRDLRRVDTGERNAAGRLFAQEVRSLRDRRLLHPSRRSFKDLKYYLRFLLMR